MFGFGILSGLTFLPLVGAALHPAALRGEDEATKQQRPLDRGAVRRR